MDSDKTQATKTAAVCKLSKINKNERQQEQNPFNKIKHQTLRGIFCRITLTGAGFKLKTRQVHNNSRGQDQKASNYYVPRGRGESPSVHPLTAARRKTPPKNFYQRRRRRNGNGNRRAKGCRCHVTRSVWWWRWWSCHAHKFAQVSG